MRLDFLKPYIKYLPEVRTPDRKPVLNEKLLWVGAALVIFFVMYHVNPIGAIVAHGGSYDFLQLVLASKFGSLITTGIGPIILASIFLQLFIGAKMIDLDMSNPDDKKLFQGSQKILAILLSFFEAGIYTIPGGIPVFPLFGPGSEFITKLFVTFQLAFGSIILLYIDEIISRYGIGSGISLFIAAGVSLAIVTGTIGIITGYGGIPPERTVVYHLSQGSASAIPDAVISLLPFIFTLIVFFVVIYFEGLKVEIPLAFERARGFGGKYPIKFLYVSNIPVILASALLMNLQIWARPLAGASYDLGGVNVVKFIADIDPTGHVSGGLLYFLTPRFYNPLATGYPAYISFFFSNQLLAVPFLGTVIVPEWIHIFTYTIFLVILCVIFGSFWIETTGMGPKEVSEQLVKAGLQIPGFRRDPRVIESVLGKYIPTITVLGSIFVGLLASFADLTGALGTGTGILLTVGILYRLYEELETQKLFELYPDVGKLVGA